MTALQSHQQLPQKQRDLPEGKSRVDGVRIDGQCEHLPSVARDAN